MSDQTPPPEKPQRGIDKMVETAERAVQEVTGEHRRPKIMSSEALYLLDEKILDGIREPFAKLGLKISDEPDTMYDYDTSIEFNLYRIQLKEGYLALIHLHERKTEAYQPNHNLAQLFDWLTNANPDLEIQAVCFFSDGETIDRPYITMANAWVKRGLLRFVEFIDQKNWASLLRRDLAARIAALKHIFDVPELEPPGAPSAAPAPSGLGGAVGQPPGTRTVVDLDQDGTMKERLVEVLKNYLVAGHPQPIGTWAANLIDSTRWPDPWKLNAKGKLMGLTDYTATARSLVEYAIDRGQLPAPHSDRTAIGDLLDKAFAELGSTDRDAVNQIKADFNL